MRKLHGSPVYDHWPDAQLSSKIASQTRTVVRGLRQQWREVAGRVAGFMPEEEGLALHTAGRDAAGVGALLEIGSYCGRSAVYLGAAAQKTGNVLYSIDHHRGSEEHQEGEGYHDPTLSAEHGRVDTLPHFAETIRAAGLQGTVLGIAADSPSLARVWRVPLGLVFIDGAHSRAGAHADLEGWSPHLLSGGLLCIHDVYPNPSDGGRPPYEIYRRALDSGSFDELSATGSLRVLRRH